VSEQARAVAAQVTEDIIALGAVLVVWRVLEWLAAATS
jgi:hypothetical protein